MECVASEQDRAGGPPDVPWCAAADGAAVCAAVAGGA